MNKKEFYKQLMSEYTFDADKIRENAKRGKNARQKLQPIYIGMSAAAAVCVVTVGTIAAVNLYKPGGVSLTDSGLTQLSAGDRLSKALEEIEKERGSSESKDFLVTFSSPLTPAQAQSVLTAYTDGSIPVKQLYFADGTRISGSDNVGRVFTGGDNNLITGAAVYCSGSVAAELQSDTAVFLVETMEQADFDNAAPVNIEEISTIDVTIPDAPVVSEPDNSVPTLPVTPTVPTNEITHESIPTEELDGTAEQPSSTEEMDGTCEPETEQVTDEGQPITNEVSDNTVIQTSDASSDTPTDSASEEVVSSDPTTNEHQSVPVEEEIIQTLPDGVVLPENVSSLNYNTYLDADSAFFLTDDTFFVKTNSEVALYRFNGSEESLICSEEISDAKLFWASDHGGKLMISGMSDYGTRGRILLVDGENGIITDLNAEDTVMSGTLASASFNSDSRLLVLNVRDEGKYYVCVSRITQNYTNEYIGTPYESDNKIVMAASKGDTIYFTENAEKKATLKSVNVLTGEERTIHSFNSIPEISRNLAFTHTVFTPNDNAVIGFTEVFDPDTETLIPLYSTEGSVNFGASRHCFIDGGSCYTISGGSISETGGITALAAIEYRKSFSGSYAATVSGSTVRITNSIYSAHNKNAMLTFSDISGNASAELRQVMNNAIGINNAIAMRVCTTSGITRSQTLIDCINLYYSPAAAKKLISRCNIDTMGAFRYEPGGLNAISAADTALVINSQSGNTAGGVLYIKAGSFGGKIAYRSVNVSFLLENGCWKLDTIL